MEVRHEADEYEARLADAVSVIRETIRRRWVVLLAVTAAVFIAAFVLVSMMTPVYSATAKVRLDPSRSPLAGNAQQTRAELSQEAIDTELTTIRSVDVAREVVRAQGLTGDPEFADSLNQIRNASLANSEARQTVVANALLQHLAVSREKQTYVLNIGFNSTDPVKAARLANAFAAAYIEFRTKRRVGTAREQSEWFQQQLADLGRQASEAEARAAEFRARAGIVESSAQNGTSGTIVDQQVAPLSGSLASAESDAAAARANLAAARAQVGRGGLDTVSEVLSSPVVADLRRQRAEVLRSKGEVEARYGERHPESIRVRDQLASIDSQLQAESRRIVGSLQATAASAEARASSLRSSLNQLERSRESSVRAATTAESLEREAAAKRALFDKTSQMSLDSMQAASAQIAQAEVVNSAEVPARPSSPNKPLLLTLAFLVAAAAGGATITAQEMLSGGFRSVEDLEAQLGIPVLAVVPRVGKSESPTELMLERPTSMFSESFRIARTAILGTRGDAGVKVIALTSSLPAEGKTTSAVAFARTLAIANARVMLLECDVRRAAVRQIIRGGAPNAGLVELLHGEISLEDAIRPGDVPNLDQILVVSPYFSAENLFGEGRMEKLLDVLRDRYDYIVMDLPPLMGLADGRYLAVLADAVALIVKWNSTPISAAKSALGWLRGDGSKPVGVIYTQVDPSAHSVGGLYYYSKQYSDYYQA
ncbi:GumC family protein [Sphingomonas jatrophae]|uniref:non-specific protein-tyrosine kinase n=1 Tax=Sphingomonas jatrophae TaxID=1166337 RepID=A0A1I6M5H9_9SPHN|nr:AAA family ATPase [Sphingomonas jatrophae]SFS10964.1 capsular exopolysaccharide family [Sphingomonas jatrophae]